MKYSELYELKNGTSGCVCLFGAGLIGSTWAYDLLSAMGFQIDYYCDNNKKENIVIRDEVKTISLETLYSFQNNVLVFITVTTKYQNSIRDQLERNGINNVICVDFHFLCTFLDSLVEMNDKNLNERFRAVLDDVEYLKKQFEYRLGYPLNLEHPRTYNEKIQWLKLYDRKPEYVQMVDKYEVKKLVTDKIGEEYVIPTLGVYDTFNDIEFDKFPNQFVLKCTHDSGSTIICKNKNEFNIAEAKTTIESYLGRNFYWIGREWPYRDVKPRIIAEPYMEDDVTHELRDYKFFIFEGKATTMFVASERGSKDETKFDFFDMEYRHLPFTNGHPNAAILPTKPEKFALMIYLAECLSKRIPHVRVDFYEVNGKVYFGEFTFSHWSGMVPFNPSSWDEKFGEWIALPETRI